MADKEAFNQVDKAPQDDTILDEESLEQVSGGNQSGQGQDKGKRKGQDKLAGSTDGGVNNLKQIGIATHNL